MRYAKRFLGSHGGTIFVDALWARPSRPGWRLGPSCHLFTLPGFLEDLNEFAAKIRLRPAWLQHGRMPHYDLTAFRRATALAAGAVEVNRSQLVEALGLWRASNEKTRIAALEAQLAEPEGLIGKEWREKVVVPVTDEEFHGAVEDLRARILGKGAQ